MIDSLGMKDNEMKDNAMSEDEGRSGEVTGPSVSISSSRDGRVVASLEFQAPKGVNIRPLLVEVAKLLRVSFAKNIDSGGNPAFRPLAKKTLRQKALHGYSEQPLLRTRLLRNSLAQSNTGGNVNGIVLGGTTLRVGTNVPYAAVHQEGSAKKGIPARPFVAIQQQDQTAIAEMVAKFNQQLQEAQNRQEAQNNAERRETGAKPEIAPGLAQASKAMRLMREIEE